MAVPPKVCLFACDSGRQSKSLRLDVDEGCSDRGDGAVEVGGFGAFEIAEEASRPRRQMLVEELLLDAVTVVGRVGEFPAGETRHHFAQDRDMVLGLALVLGARDA